MSPAYAGIDVAVAKGKRLPVSVCLRCDGRLEPLPLRSLGAPLPPKLPGNVPILDVALRQGLAAEAVEYLVSIERAFDVRIERVAIDAPRAPRSLEGSLRECESALDQAGIRYIQTPDARTFDRIPEDVAEYRRDPGARIGLPHANRIWMLFGFDLFKALSDAGRPCIEVYPQATVRGLGVGERHKKTRGAVLEQLKAASVYTGWPATPSEGQLRLRKASYAASPSAASMTAWMRTCRRGWRVCPSRGARRWGSLRTM